MEEIDKPNQGASPDRYFVALHSGQVSNKATFILFAIIILFTPSTHKL